MAEVIGWLVAGAAAVVAMLFGGAWLHERKQRGRAGADYEDLARRSLKQKLKIRELVIRAEEQARMQERARGEIRTMADHARTSSPADDYAARIRGDTAASDGDDSNS